MSWMSLAIGDGPIEGPMGEKFIQCHARWQTYDRTIRCRNYKRRDRIGQCPPDEWLCYVHAETEVAFSDRNPCMCFEPQANTLMGYLYHPDAACPFHGTRTPLRKKENHG